VAYASARAGDGAVVYRCYGVWLWPEVEYMLNAEDLAAFG